MYQTFFSRVRQYYILNAFQKRKYPNNFLLIHSNRASVPTNTKVFFFYRSAHVFGQKSEPANEWMGRGARRTK